MKMRFYCSLALLLLCSFFLLNCSCNRKTTLLQKIKKNGKIVVYSNPEFPPFEYIDADGEIAGVEIDLVKRIAQTIGVKVELHSSIFSSIQAAVESGEADMGASGFTITDERKMKVDFSIPFASSVQYMILPANSKIRAIEMLAFKKIGVQQDTTGHALCKKICSEGFLKDTNVEIKPYVDAIQAMLAMKGGQIDAIVVDELVAIALAQKNSGYKAIKIQNLEGKEVTTPEEFGIMIAPGNYDFLNIINQVIKDMKQDNSLEASYIKHFEASTTMQ